MVCMAKQNKSNHNIPHYNGGSFLLPNKLGMNILDLYIICIYDAKNEYFSKFFEMIKQF
jgi:hypothetical protein